MSDFGHSRRYRCVRSHIGGRRHARTGPICLPRVPAPILTTRGTATAVPRRGLLDLATRDARTVTNDSAMHLPALAQGVDVDAKGSHHALQRTMIAASSGKTA